MLKLVNIILFGFIAVSLSACNGSTNETYAEKIERFELDHAIDLVLLAERNVQESNNVTVANEEYPNFLSYPIPTYFKSLHQTYGVDTSKLQYVDQEWLQQIHKLDQESAKYGATVIEHSHHH